jgi:hypothetical protein
MAELADCRASANSRSMPSMPNERPQLPTKETPPKQEKGARSGEGSRSVIPHLKSDQRARAVARLGKRPQRDF